MAWTAIAPGCTTCKLDTRCTDRIQIGLLLLDLRESHPEHHGCLVIRDCRQRVPIPDEDNLASGE